MYAKYAKTRRKNTEPSMPVSFGRRWGVSDFLPLAGQEHLKDLQAPEPPPGPPGAPPGPLLGWF